MPRLGVDEPDDTREIAFARFCEDHDLDETNEAVSMFENWLERGGEEDPDREWDSRWDRDDTTGDYFPPIDKTEQMKGDW